MPPLPAVPNVAAVRLSIENQVTLHTSIIRHFYQWTGGVSSTADMQALATAVYNAWATQFITADHNADSILIGATAEDLSSGSAPVGSHITPTNGGGGSKALAAQACAQINWGIDRRYRGGKPKTFVPELNDVTTNDDHSFTTSFVGHMNSLANNLAGGSGSVLTASYPSITGLHMVNVSYFHGFTNVTLPSGRQKAKPQVRAVPLVDVITRFACKGTLATQRRRLLPS